MLEMERRRAATEKTVKRYRNKVFDWGTGVTCAHLLRVHLRNMGHKPPTVPRFRSALMAKRALTDLGFDSMEAMLDSLVPRLPAPAFAKMGDVVLMEGDAGLEAVLVCAGPRTFFGWHQDHPQAAFLEIDFAGCKGAWHV